MTNGGYCGSDCVDDWTIPNLSAQPVGAHLPFRELELVLSASSSDRIRLQLGADDDIPCLDVAEVSSSKALLWHTVEIRSKGRVDALSGLTAKSAQTLRDDLLAFVNQHLAELIDSDKR